MRVIGTAGHVDHGKSTLVRALTGIEPDRLKEEKEREMTIDLGFAWVMLPSGIEASIVDVPGHEDLIKNMLAGIGGIDLAILVVAADEGVMPQTREHLAILDLLEIRDGVVALTKSDLIDDPEWLELVQEQVREELAGTALQDARIIPVSARTRQGLDDLVAELDRLLRAPPPRPETGRPRLPIDRVFSMAGFGTIVTGTLIDGRLHTGDDLVILPRGIQTRVRGLQSHGSKVEEAVPPSRVAVNLTGISTDDVQRGDVLTAPGWIRPTTLLDARLRVVKNAPRPLAYNSIVDFYTGAAKTEARVRILDRQEIAPGDEGWVQFVLTSPVVVVKGDYFIVRQASPSLTWGGGTIVDPHPQRRHRRFRSETIERLQVLAHGTPEEIILQELRREEPRETSALVAYSSLGKNEATSALSSLLKDNQVIQLGRSNGQGADAPAGNRYVMSIGGWHALNDRLIALLSEYHRRNPLRQGMPREELKSRLQLPARAFNDALATSAERGAIRETEAFVALASHRVVFDAQQQKAIDALLQTFRQQPYSPPSFQDSENAVGSAVLASLIEQGTLVKVSDSVLFARETYDKMKEAVIDHLRQHGSITLAQIRDLFGTSRKYAQALIEHLDDLRITRRVGDERVLR